MLAMSLASCLTDIRKKLTEGGTCSKRGGGQQNLQELLDLLRLIQRCVGVLWLKSF